MKYAINALEQGFYFFIIAYVQFVKFGLRINVILTPLKTKLVVVLTGLPSNVISGKYQDMVTFFENPVLFR